MKRVSIVLMAVLIVSGCAGLEDNKRTKLGTGIGAATGAVLGAVIGHQSGHKERGAAIGGAVGAVTGGLIGRKLDKQAEELSKVADTKRTEAGIVTTLKSNILFASDSAVLQGGAMDQIGELGKIIGQYPENKVVVVGHTDSKGDTSHNQKLSEKRAQSVRLQMVSGGALAKSVEAVGQGESQPVASNDSEDGRAKNRRVEILISAPPEAQ
jgi:outer membrane protein OmpA-like peptidoglycan-associated protein